MNPKGISSILIILIIVGVLVAAGVYYYQIKKTEKINETKPAPINKLLSLYCDRNHSSNQEFPSRCPLTEKYDIIFEFRREGGEPVTAVLLENKITQKDVSIIYPLCAPLDRMKIDALGAKFAKLEIDCSKIHETYYIDIEKGEKVLESYGYGASLIKWDGANKRDYLFEAKYLDSDGKEISESELLDEYDIKCRFDENFSAEIKIKDISLNGKNLEVIKTPIDITIYPNVPFGCDIPTLSYTISDDLENVFVSYGRRQYYDEPIENPLLEFTYKFKSDVVESLKLNSASEE